MIRRSLEAGGDFVYEFPSTDRGDPGLEFILAGDAATIRTTIFTDDSWKDIEETSEQSTTRSEFESLVRGARNRIEQAVLEARPRAGPAWLERNRRG